jgi:hypothetical protein
MAEKKPHGKKEKFFFGKLDSEQTAPFMVSQIPKMSF